MESLKDKLLEMQKKLPKGNETDFDDLYEIYMMDLHEILGSGRGIWEFDNGTSETLSEPMQNYYYALWYIQSVIGLLDTINCDGFLSVFYNWSGNEIDALKTVLKRFDDKLEPLVAQAYNLLHPIYKFEPDTNVVTKDPDVDFFDIIPQDVMNQLKAIEDNIQEYYDETYDYALSLYKSVTS